jgi:hypothetical protein
LYGREWFEDEVRDIVAFTPISGGVDVGHIGRVESYVVPTAELAVLLNRGPLRDIEPGICCPW